MWLRNGQMETIDIQIKDPIVRNKVDGLIEDLKHGNILGSYQLAKNTVEVLLHMISKEELANVKKLISVIREQGQRLMSAQPSETVVGNMVYRVLKIIRDECRAIDETAEEQSQESIQKSSTAPGDDVSNKDILSLKKLLLAEGDVDISDKSISSLKAPIIDAVNELLVELDTSQENISAQALEHIHSNEVIMTAGQSHTVEAFFKKAAKKRTFKVIVVECAPFYQGQKMATNLASAGINTTLITDSAVFAMMARVNKVIIGTHTVMANGGLKAINGCHAIALAAKYHSVPLVVCAPMYKLSPKYLCSCDQVAFNKFASPEDVMSFSEGEILSKAQIYNPIFDYVPPELVTLYIFNIGGNAPSYVYRLLSELYDTEDQEL
ncbi:hypothetical protein LSH36_173g00055 [Paralvinella palmiformis]|uniref:Translation initiation factor eIF2B subunit beta n=1 Tax=Paralvinella palmiformis TaxID=53620 RepID=A0AAD9JSS9_9ANNE|nr:hypothetical protein LSH36_173g00055 [Paralvinella palmiformis]